MVPRPSQIGGLVSAKAAVDWAACWAAGDTSVCATWITLAVANDQPWQIGLLRKLSSALAPSKGAMISAVDDSSAARPSAPPPKMPRRASFECLRMKDLLLGSGHHARNRPRRIAASQLRRLARLNTKAASKVAAEATIQHFYDRGPH